MTLDRYAEILRFVYTEPKFVALVEWEREYGIAAQLQAQWPRDEMEHYAATGQHVNPGRRLSLRIEPMPDFDWWEPRHDQPWRRQQARERNRRG